LTVFSIALNTFQVLFHENDLSLTFPAFSREPCEYYEAHSPPAELHTVCNRSVATLPREISFTFLFLYTSRFVFVELCLRNEEYCVFYCVLAYIFATRCIRITDDSFSNYSDSSLFFLLDYIRIIVRLYIYIYTVLNFFIKYYFSFHFPRKSIPRIYLTFLRREL